MGQVVSAQVAAGGVEPPQDTQVEGRSDREGQAVLAKVAVARAAVRQVAVEASEVHLVDTPAGP